ncbi:MAG: hypothetical protein ACM3NR_04005 [Methanosarcina sp.]
MFLRISAFLSILIFNCSIAVSQLYYLNLPPGQNKLYVGDKRIPGLVGSPYLSDDWSTGSITLYNGNVINNLPLKYNVYLKEFHYQADKNEYILGSPDSVLFITMNGKRFMYLPFEEKKIKQKDYFEVLTGDESQLLLRHTASITKSNYNIALNAGEKDNRLEQKKLYYLRKYESIVLIDKKGKNLYNLLNDKSEELKQFSLQNHLSFTNEDDLKRIIDYYNSFFPH